VKCKPAYRRPLLNWKGVWGTSHLICFGRWSVGVSPLSNPGSGVENFKGTRIIDAASKIRVVRREKGVGVQRVKVPSGK